MVDADVIHVDADVVLDVNAVAVVCLDGHAHDSDYVSV